MRNRTFSTMHYLVWKVCSGRLRLAVSLYIFSSLVPYFHHSLHLCMKFEIERKMKLLAFFLCLCCLIFFFQSSTEARAPPLPPTPGRLQPPAPRLPPPAGRFNDQPRRSPPPPGAPPGGRPWRTNQRYLFFDEWWRIIHIHMPS